MTHWYEDEDFWRTLFPYIFTEEKFQVAEAEVEKILQLARFDGRDVLDLACGPGRHTLALAERGLKVTGVDRSEFLLSKARGRAEEKGLEVEWLQQDMRQFAREEAFDLAISLFTSFGYFEADEDNLGVLRNVRRSLREGGILVLDMNGKESLARRFQSVRLNEYDDGALLVDRAEIEQDWRRVRSEWILIRDDDVRRFEFSVRLYSGEEMQDALRSAGFGQARVYGDLDGSRYAADATRLVAVGFR